MNPTVERRLAAIMAVDVVGYSRLMGADEVGTLRKLKAHRGDLIDPVIAGHRGRIVKTTGDGLLVEFPSVVQAVACAVAVQRGMLSRNAPEPEDKRVVFRIGINVGDIIIDGNDIFGDGVNVAARLESLCEPGGLCISRTANDQIQDKLSLPFVDLGEHTVKNITRPVGVFGLATKDIEALPEEEVHREPQPTLPAVATASLPRHRAVRFVAAASVAILLAGGVWFASQYRAAPTSNPVLPDRPSIAVLPFENMGGDPEQAYFADGMTEDLITDLSKIAGLLVIARNSTFAYKGKGRDIREIAKALGVRYILEGSVRRAGAEVRINAQLIDATTGGHLWADRYDGEMKNVFGLQDKVTRSVVSALAVKLTQEDRERVTRHETENAQAYDVFLKGWQHYLLQTPEDFRTAIDYFKKAADLDPKYGRAYAALAATYWEASTRYWDVALGFKRHQEARAQAEHYLTQAMRNPTPLAHQVASAILLQGQQHGEAIAEAKLAIAADPNDADAYIALANALSFTGKAAEALDQVERAIRLNPHYPPQYLYQRGLAQFAMKQLDKAAADLEQAIGRNRDDYWSQRLLLATYGLLGRRADAAKTIESIKAGTKQGRLAFYDPLTIRATTYWYPFAENSDAERFADGLRKAGIPE
jgi:TolB-like protein/class 3 adenylate cyclase/tetratricopeptide (TPR) repeat protein